MLNGKQANYQTVAKIAKSIEIKTSSQISHKMILLVFIVPLKPIRSILHIQRSAMKRVSPTGDNTADAKSQRLVGLSDDASSSANVHVLPFSVSLSNATAITAAPPHELSDMPY